LSYSLFYRLSRESVAVQHSVITFQTNCEHNTIPMLITVSIPYSVSIKNKQILKGGMTYV
jgi:GTP cyclohydrolase I